jgi:hypothetical protein
MSDWMIDYSFSITQSPFLLHDIDTVDVFIRFDRPGWCRFGGI